MPEYLNQTQAARLLGISDRTLRGWLAAGRFPGAKKKVNGNWAIPLAEVEAQLAGTTERSETSAAAMLKILELFTQEIEDLRRRIDELSAELHKEQPPPAPPPVDIYSTIRQPRSTGDSGNLPDGYVALVAFHHGVPETTIGHWRKRDRRNASIGDWRDSSGHPIKVALSPEQQAAFYRAFSTHKNFKPCPQCPHSAQI